MDKEEIEDTENGILVNLIIKKILKERYPNGFNSLKKLSKEIYEEVNDFYHFTRLEFLVDANILLYEEGKYLPLATNDIDYKMQFYHSGKHLDFYERFLEKIYPKYKVSKLEEVLNK